jgi:hypothetical protein
MVLAVSPNTPTSNFSIPTSRVFDFGLPPVPQEYLQKFGREAPVLSVLEDKAVIMLVPSLDLPFSQMNFSSERISQLHGALKNHHVPKPVSMRLEGPNGFVQQIRHLGRGHIALDTCCKALPEGNGAELRFLGLTLNLVDPEKGIALSGKYNIEYKNNSGASTVSDVCCKGRIDINRRGQQSTYLHLQLGSGTDSRGLIGQLNGYGLNGYQLTGSRSYSQGEYLPQSTLEGLLSLFRKPRSIGLEDLGDSLRIPLVF